MKCVVCGKKAGHNRVVVDTIREVEKGGICVACEEDQFGKHSEKLGSKHSELCLFCSRDAAWALAKLKPTTTHTGGMLVSSVTYDLETVTLQLCDQHLHEIAVYLPVETQPDEDPQLVKKDNSEV